MNSYSEQEYRWAQEVLYLHSLWRQGPPHQNPTSSSRHLPPRLPTFYPSHSSYPYPNPNPHFHPNPNPNPYSHPYPNPTRYYQTYPYPYPRTHLSPERTNGEQQPDPSPGNEWPCDPTPAPGQSSPNTWAQCEQPSSNPTAVSPSSSTRASFVSMQRAAIQTCKYFFTQDSDADSESELESESESESESGHDADDFFRSLFENATQLRGCYEKYHKNGEFYCLVCETRGDGKKRKGKMYRGCTALAQHAWANHKLGRRAGHKAFARAICRVLGWDPQRLPAIVLLPGSVVIAGHYENPISSSDSPETRKKRDPSDGPPGQNLEKEPINSPGTGACPPEDVPDAGDSGTEKISKEKGLDQVDISEICAKENPEVIIRQNPISNSDSLETRTRDPSGGPPGQTLEKELMNSPIIGACPPPEGVPDAGDSGTEKISKGKDPEVVARQEKECTSFDA